MLTAESVAFFILYLNLHTSFFSRPKLQQFPNAAMVFIKVLNFFNDEKKNFKIFFLTLKKNKVRRQFRQLTVSILIEQALCMNRFLEYLLYFYSSRKLYSILYHIISIAIPWLNRNCLSVNCLERKIFIICIKKLLKYLHI